MKKRKLVVGVLILFMLLAIPFLLAVNDTENDSEVINTGNSDSDVSLDNSVNENSQVDDAYDCLTEKVNDAGCDSLSVEQKIFALWADGHCKSSLLSARQNSECWSVTGSSGNCDVKTTAQAILALKHAGTDTENSEAWLLDNKQTPNDMFWYLQIENNGATTCEVTYGGSPYNFNIGEDKKISSSAGSCLSLSSDRYWFSISNNCYDNEFEVSCDKGFSTTLLFKKQGSSTIHVSDQIQSSSAEGTTSETVNSYCFSSSSSGCDYEGSLWAAMALSSTNNEEEVENFYPYLIALEESNPQYLPESFLYFLTNYDDFRNTLLLKQISDEYWDVSGNKFYDTSLALYPFVYESPQEKSNAKSWLLDIQGDDGCWNNGNIRDTAFVLASTWPQDSAARDDSIDCEEQGNHCLSSIACSEAGGSTISGQDCAGSYVCCSESQQIATCSAQIGLVCNSDEVCTGGRVEAASDTSYGQTCCVGGGTCETGTIVDETECEIGGGICTSFGCANDEESINYECETLSQTCCVEKTSEGSLWWLWVLLIILIILVVLGIIFRDRLRPYWFKVKSKFKKDGKNPRQQGRPGPRGPGPSSGIPMSGGPRGMLPRQPPRRSMPPRPQPSKKPSEMDDILKKLKDMGK